MSLLEVLGILSANDEIIPNLNCELEFMCFDDSDNEIPDSPDSPYSPDSPDNVDIFVGIDVSDDPDEEISVKNETIQDLIDIGFGSYHGNSLIDDYPVIDNCAHVDIFPQAAMMPNMELVIFNQEERVIVDQEEQPIVEQGEPPIVDQGEQSIVEQGEQSIVEQGEQLIVEQGEQLIVGQGEQPSVANSDRKQIDIRSLFSELKDEPVILEPSRNEQLVACRKKHKCSYKKCEKVHPWNLVCPLRTKQECANANRSICHYHHTDSIDQNIRLVGNACVHGNRCRDRDCTSVHLLRLMQ